MKSMDAVAASGTDAKVSDTKTANTPTIKIIVAIEKAKNNVCPRFPIYSLIIVPIGYALCLIDACNDA